MVRNGNRVGVGCYVGPITPLWSVHANIRLGFAFTEWDRREPS